MKDFLNLTSFETVWDFVGFFEWWIIQIGSQSFKNIVKENKFFSS